MGITYTTTAVNTYVPIATYTIPTAVSTYTFSIIPAGYTDLVCIVNMGTSLSTATTFGRFNGDTATNYSSTVLEGSGTAASSYRYSTQSGFRINMSNSQTLGVMSAIMHIQNYANTTTYKTVLVQTNVPTGSTCLVSSLWRATPAAINSFTIYVDNGNMLAGSTFTLYGILGA